MQKKKTSWGFDASTSRLPQDLLGGQVLHGDLFIDQVQHVLASRP